MRNLRLSLCVGATLALAACASTGGQPTHTAPPQTAARVTEGIERYLEQRARVEAVGFRLRKAALSHCAKQKAAKPELGLIVWSLANFDNEGDRAHLKTAFALTEQVTIALATEGAPAATAGLYAGQVITHVDGQALRDGKGATERFLALSNAAARNGPVRLRVSGGGEVTLRPETVCEFPVLLVRSPEINASADGSTLAITSGLFDLTRSDDELALILGHELAHNVLGHLKRPVTKKPGGILDAFVRATIGAAVAAAAGPPFSVAAEKEADYAGLYFMVRAGYDTAAAEPFWQRVNATTRATSLVKTHPSGRERLAALQAAIAEIKAKQKSKKPLEPNLKPRQ